MKADKIETKARGLFCCETAFQLFNAIVICLTHMQNIPCDVILTEHSDFSKIEKRLIESHIFENVWQYSCRSCEIEWRDKRGKEQHKLFLHPDLFLKNAGSIEPVYTDLFLPIDHLCLKMIYYSFVKKGRKPAVYMYEEGKRSYTMNMLENQHKVSTNDIDVYGTDALSKNIKGLYLYEPELYSVKNDPVALLPIPKLFQNENITEKLKAVFTIPELPAERYIYFEESYLVDLNVSNDMELLDLMASIVGKENIIVKRHPRNPYNRFTSRGYKTMGSIEIPWEVQLLNTSLREKVLVTVASTASMTPFLLFGYHIPTIHLIKMFQGTSKLLQDKDFSDFYKKTLSLCNKDTLSIYTPCCKEELTEIVSYIAHGSKR
jgi:hypothetical protein